MREEQTSLKKRFIKLPKEKVDEVLSTMIEITLKKSETPEKTKGDNFLLVRDVLSRIGILKNNKLYQSVHILQKKGRYFLCHFKQLFALDGLENSINELDLKRLHKIAFLLQKWGMVDVVNKKIVEGLEDDTERNVFVHIVPAEKVKSGEIVCIKKYDL